ncbi:MAG: hypothetical protein ABI600_11745 [Luteolibacter sp.]
MKKTILLLVSLLICACGTANRPSVSAGPAAQAGLGFLPQKAEKGALFQYYQPRARSKWRNNWTHSFDLTGVSWNDPRTATLIAPSYVVMAAHFTRPANVPLIFHDPEGNPQERYIASVRALGVGDIAVAKLNRPLPPGIKCYRFASTSDATIGRPVIVSDQTKTLSVHRLGGISGAVVQFDYLPNLDSIYRRNLIVGDSGNPSFLVKNGDLVLLETHTTGGPGAGPLYADPNVQAAIRAAMNDMGN